MAIQIGETIPNLEVETTEGRLKMHDWIGDSYAILFSHPKDFTPVCTTELGHMARLKPEFDKRNVKVMGLSVDPVDDHKRWSADIERATGDAPNYPMIGDRNLSVAKAFGMLPADSGRKSEGRTAAANQTVRTVFVIGPDMKVKLTLSYPMSTGRNFEEILRVVDSIQLTATHHVATPVNWKHGEDVVILPAVSDAEAKQRYPDGWDAPLPYLRYVPEPPLYRD